ncbi:hypothetical protein [Clostridium sp.]|uniref:hypothetical protein n=1 Tax=Clostridium sp. TaxID=1506 RepID=UPI00284FAAF7|nr:hypothetical protein [Clostridium sp.]MDR3596577.1 hypothetical protein [Clostridium sp.]
MLADDSQAFKVFKDERVKSFKQALIQININKIVQLNKMFKELKKADKAVESERKRSREHWLHLDNRHLDYLIRVRDYIKVEIQSFQSNTTSNIHVIKDLISNLNNLETDFETMGNTERSDYVNRFVRGH